MIIISEFSLEELQKYQSKQELIQMFQLVHMLQLFKIVEIHEDDLDSARLLSEKTKVHRGDCIHAVIAKKYDAILITRDGHFSALKQYVCIRKPEEL
jgi:predicted nucleic acid-binding protein